MGGIPAQEEVELDAISAEKDQGPCGLVVDQDEGLDDLQPHRHNDHLGDRLVGNRVQEGCLEPRGQIRHQTSLRARYVPYMESAALDAVAVRCPDASPRTDRHPASIREVPSAEAGDPKGRQVQLAGPGA